MPLKEHMRTHHCADKSPLSFNIGQPFSLQMNQLQVIVETETKFRKLMKLSQDMMAFAMMALASYISNIMPLEGVP